MKILVVYYSFSGITKFIAQTMAQLMDADEFELLPEIPYSFDYDIALKEAKNQIDKGCCPELMEKLPDTKAYDKIFIGSPNWLGTFAPPVLTFLRKADLKNKKVVPFCTHGGGGFGKIEDDMIKECPNSEVLPILSMLSDSSLEYVEELLKKNQFI